MNETKWLAMATSDDDDRLNEIFQGGGYVFALDSYRMHIAKMDYDEIGDIAHEDIVSKAIKICQDAVVIERFGINPVYLAEALLAWADNAPDEPVIIEYCHSRENGSNFIHIKNSHYDDPKQVIIMCMRLIKESEPLPEKMQSKNESAKENEDSAIDNQL